jgi:nucleoside-diphosphate-sugar epimerase
MPKAREDSLVLVSGASGFVGAAVTRALRAAGTSVLAIDVRGDTAAGVVPCDLLEAHRLHELVRGRQVGAILHCGGISGPMLYADRPALIARTNIEGTLNLLELARIHGVARFVFCSSAAVYGPRGEGEITPVETALHPRSVYAASKVAGEALLEAYASGYGLDGVSLRIAAVYGPNRRTDCLIRTMILAGFAQQPLSIPVGGSQRYHFVHIDDVVAALLAALSANPARRAHTIAGGPGVTLRELADIVRAVVPGPDIVIGAAPDPLSDPQGAYDLSSARADLGWAPAVPLAAGIAAYADWLRQGPSRASARAAGTVPVIADPVPAAGFFTGDAAGTPLSGGEGQ